MSVTDKDALLVVSLAVRGRGDSEPNVRGRVGQSFTASRITISATFTYMANDAIDLREGQGELARRVQLAKEDIRQTVTNVVSSVERLHQGRSLVRPRHGDRGSGLVDDDGVGRDGEDSRDELVRGSRKASERVKLCQISMHGSVRRVQRLWITYSMCFLS